MNKGKIVQIIGAVVDVEFDSSKLPTIYNALIVNRKSSIVSQKDKDDKRQTTNDKLILETQQHLGEGVVRAVSMGKTDGLKRGTEV